MNLSKLSVADTKTLTNGKLIASLGIRDPYKMWRCHKRKRSEKLKPIPGLYFLFCKKELVYVGKATELSRRILDHIRGREFLKGYYSKYDGRWRHDRTIPPKEFDTIAKLYISLEAAEYVEPIYIAYFRPVLNKVGVDQPVSQLDIFTYDE